MTQSDDKGIVKQMDVVSMPIALDLPAISAVLGMTIAQVVENAYVLKSAQNYLKLRSDFAELSTSRGVDSIPSPDKPKDLSKLDNGVSILCAAHTEAALVGNADVCADIQKEIFSLSDFYQEKVANAYVLACNIVFDADSLSDKPALLKQLVNYRNALQQVHYAWPEEKNESNMKRFYEKVDIYGRQLGIDGRVCPELKSSYALIPLTFMNERERCA